jgi:hypothetical protein
LMIFLIWISVRGSSGGRRRRDPGRELRDDTCEP